MVIDFFFRCLLWPIEGLLSDVLGESPDALWSVDFKLIFGASGQVAHFETGQVAQFRQESPTGICQIKTEDVCT